MKKKVNLINSEEGFTLIEVIAVLIILGILAAVAVPRYFDLSDEAATIAAESAASQGVSLCTLVYHKYALQFSTEPSRDKVVELASAANASTQGDFDISITKGTGDKEVNVTATSKSTANFTKEVTVVWTLPNITPPPAP